jgi:hypothetical protein
MATITIQKQDGIVVVDGYATYDQDVSALASNIWAIQFDSTSNTGHIEYNDDTVNETITSLTSDMQALVTLNTNAKATADAEETATKNSYQYKRGLEYPTIGDQLDSLYHAGTFDATMTATIKAVKDKYPK